MSSEGFTPPKIYLRVGPTGSGHTSFIKNVARTCELKLFSKRTMTPMKIFHARFSHMFHNFIHSKGKKMVAFDNTQAKHMCTPRPFKFFGNRTYGDIDTWIFSINDNGMKKCGEIDANDVLAHAFSEDLRTGDGLMARRIDMYLYITEIHHMLPDGSVRILASGGKKLQDPIVLSALECIERVCVQ